MTPAFALCVVSVGLSVLARSGQEVPTMASESDEIDWDAIWDEIQEALREHALEVIGRIKKAPQTWTPVVGTQPLPDAWEGGRQRIRQ